MMVMNKRGQVSTLIFLIMVVIVFYILLLPPGERGKLLEENVTGISGTTTSNLERINLLSVDVGSLSFVKEKEIEHSLTSVLLEERAGAVVFSEISPFTIRKGWFTLKSKSVAFTVASPELVDRAILSFQLAKSRGGLVVKLNDVEVFDGELSTGEPKVIALNKDLLRKINTLSFEAVGIGFFAREFSFKDVKVVGDVLEAGRRSSLQTFVVPSEEQSSLASGYLSFYAVCNRETVGALMVSLNGRIISSSVPNCNSLNRFELVSSDFNVGRNELEFSMPVGKARLDSVLVKSKLKPSKSHVEYFNINSTVIRDVDVGKRRVWLKVAFVDDASRKFAEINLNGILSTIDQSNARYEKDITSRVREGNNYFVLTPKTELNVVNLQISAE